MNGILALFFSVQMCLNLKLQILQMSALVTLGLVHAVDSFLITDSIYHGWRTAPRGALGLSLAISSVLAWAIVAIISLFSLVSWVDKTEN